MPNPAETGQPPGIRGPHYLAGKVCGPANVNLGNRSVSIIVSNILANPSGSRI